MIEVVQILIDVAILTYAPPRTELPSDFSIASGDNVIITSDESEWNRSVITYTWSRTGGTGNANILTGVTLTEHTLSFTADTLTAGGNDVTHTFQLLITDDLGQTSTDSITITITAPPPVNQAPASNAGPDQRKNSGSLVTLDGTGSDDPDDADTITYTWRQISGTMVNLSNTTISQPTFTAPTLINGVADVVLIFGLIVRDNHDVDSSENRVEITINAPPKAIAGDDVSVTSGNRVTINGLGQDNENSVPTSYAWTRVSGSGNSNILNGITVNSNVLSFIADTLPDGAPSVTHTLRLTVTDADGLTHFDDVVVTVTSVPLPNRAPVANPGPDMIIKYADRETVQLNGSATDVNLNDVLSYSWRRSGGTSGYGATFSNSNIKNPVVNFTGSSTTGSGSVRHILRLTVSDQGGLSHFLALNVFILTPNQFTDEIDAGNKVNVKQNESIILSEAVGIEGATYEWSIISAGRNRPAARIDNHTSLKPMFVAPRSIRSNRSNEKYFLNFKVTKLDGTIGNDIVECLVLRDETLIGNRPPSAHAGENITANSGDIVTLDGRLSSDPDTGDTLIYSWSRIGGTGSAVTLTNSNTNQPTFTADTLTSNDTFKTHVFELTVSDRTTGGYSDTAQVRVTVNPPPNMAPTANAGEDRSVTGGTTITLSGSGSDDSDGTIISYRWRRESGTGDSSIMLINETSRDATFTTETLTAGAASVTHRFGLIVTDDDGASSTEDFIVITVTAPRINRAPTANAGPDQLLLPTYTKDSNGQFVKTVVDLTGVASSDPDTGDTLTYAWRMKSKSHSIGSDLIITDGTTSTPTVQQTTPLEKGNNGNNNSGRRIVTYTAELIVTDSDDTASDPDTVNISFVAPPEIII